ncbi:MAG: hypothetical protein LC768_13625 [Acidobacteria bacterium]|nr:hypothetical protein [Acidobacteriota bacterium]MCA1639350.1 hypothetical protein [Acidobacteriota bacterium]
MNQENAESEKGLLNLFDKIRARAEENRQARNEEKRKTDEYFERIKSGAGPLDDVNQILTGENK